MAIQCDSCGAQNPRSNRFCGQCGTKLALAVADPPEEFCRDRAAPSAAPLEASADLPPEIIDFDNQIPLFAGEDAERQPHPPAGLVEEIHDQLEREAEMHDQLRHGSEPHYEVRAREDAARDAQAMIDAAQSGDLSEFRPRNFLADGEKTAHTGVSGPSFLGLTDDHSADYLLEEDAEPRSHLRRNIALAVLAGVVLLAGLQWRSVRDYGLEYMENGSMRVKPRVKGDALQNPPAVAADNTSRDLGLAPRDGQAGSAKALANSPNADRTPDAQQSATTAQTARTKQKVSSPGQQPAGLAQPTAMSAPTPDVPAHSATAAKRPSAAQSTATVASTKADARPAPHSATVPGADEMSRAAHASDAEARAAWLWRAVSKGNPQAPVELARMYEQGNGVVRNCDQARVLLRAAAAKGNEQARYSLEQIRIRGGCSVR